jgi:hypothetical protein
LRAHNFSSFYMSLHKTKFTTNWKRDSIQTKYTVIKQLLNFPEFAFCCISCTNQLNCTPQIQARTCLRYFTTCSTDVFEDSLALFLRIVRRMQLQKNRMRPNSDSIPNSVMKPTCKWYIHMTWNELLIILITFSYTVKANETMRKEIE